MNNQMKKIAVVLLLLISTGPGFAFQNSSEWIRYNSPGGRYSVLLPSQPEPGTQESATAEGIKFTQYMATLIEGNSVYLIGYFDHVPGTEFSFDRARDGMINAFKGTLLSESAISLGGSPGRDLKIDAKSEAGTVFLVRARIYDIDKRVYVLQFIIPKPQDDSEAAAKCAKYFDSFQVTKTP